MNLYYFISNRIRKVSKESFSYLVSRVAVASIGFGLMVMILAFAILQGFQEKIKQKIFSFGAHIEITKYDFTSSEEASPISLNTRLYENYHELETVEHLQVFSLKPSLLLANDEVFGVVFKGVGPDFRTENFKENLEEGQFIRFDTTGDSFSEDIIISRKLADQLQVSIGDEAHIIFLREGGRQVNRKLNIRDIYSTGLEEFDDKVIMGDIRLNQKLNQWGDSLVGGYEIFLKDFDDLDKGYEEVYRMMDNDLYIQTVKQKYLQIFDWLVLLKNNVIIFIVLILLVASFNMVSTVIIMIMERTNMIGILKALGATNRQIHRVFIFNGLYLILKGMVLGNLIGLGLVLFQYYTQIIPLDEANYYMTYVPVKLDWAFFGLLNLATLIFTSLVLIIPVIFISHIRPIRAIKFD